MLTLSEKLKTIIKTIDQHKSNEIHIKELAKNIKAANIRRNRKYMLSNIFNKIVDDIMLGKIPNIKIENYDDKIWIKQVSTTSINVIDYDLWLHFINKLYNEYLEIKIENDNDDVGQKNWLVIKVIPTHCMVDNQPIDANIRS